MWCGGTQRPLAAPVLLAMHGGVGVFIICSYSPPGNMHGGPDSIIGYVYGMYVATQAYMLVLWCVA
jgi:hypothetical protein